MKLKRLLYLGFFLFINHTSAQETNFLTLHDSENLKVQGYFQFGSNLVAENNLFWNLADVPELDYASDTQWWENYAKPGIGFNYHTGQSKSSKLYGKFSLVWSSTLGTDAFDTGDTGRTTIEEAHIGYIFNLNETSNLDLSIGAQQLKLGTGMLISNGGVSGFERGALKFGPRKAWEMSAVGRYNNKDFNLTGFYIDPNELPSNDTQNEIFGFDINVHKSANRYIGLSYINVVASNAPYPKAVPPGSSDSPEITFGAREGLNALNFYGKSYPFKNSLKDLFTAIDFAYQWNSRINLNAWGGRAQIGYDFKEVKWSPTMMVAYQIFSGDDPNTEGQERFDPLYYEGSPSSWATGSKSSMVFINSNVKAFTFSFRMVPSPRDIITLRYTNIAVQQLRSPIQFGQAGRVEIDNGTSTVVSGVTEPSLGNDFFIEYNRVINKNIFFNAGFSVGIAGKGITVLTDNTDNWTGAFANIVFNY